MCRESQRLSGAVVQFQNWKAGWHETLEQIETCTKALVLRAKQPIATCKDSSSEVACQQKVGDLQKSQAMKHCGAGILVELQNGK